MDPFVLVVIGFITLLIWAGVIHVIISSASRSKKIVKLLALIAEKQGASEDEIFKATKSEDEIQQRERKLRRELKRQQKDQII